MRSLLATQNAFLRVVMHLYGGLYGLQEEAVDMLDRHASVGVSETPLVTAGRYL